MTNFFYRDKIGVLDFIKACLKFLGLLWFSVSFPMASIVFATILITISLAIKVHGKANFMLETINGLQMPWVIIICFIGFVVFTKESYNLYQYWKNWVKE